LQKTIQLNGIIKKNIKDSSFSITVSSKESDQANIPLLTLFKQDKIHLSNKINNLLSKVAFSDIEITISIGKEKKALLEGNIILNNKIVQSSFMIFQNDLGEVIKKIEISLPEKSELKILAPELAKRFKIVLDDQKLIITNHEYKDETLNLNITPGANLIGSLNIEDIQDLVEKENNPAVAANLEKTLELLESFVKTLLVHIVLTKDPYDSSIRFIVPPGKIEKIPLSKLINFKKAHTLGKLKKTLQNLSFVKPELDITVGMSEQKFLLNGGIFLYDKMLKTQVFINNNENQNNNVSIKILFPSDWKLSELSSKFKKLDSINLEAPMIMYSNFPYNDSDLNITVVEGLTLLAGVDLQGPLKPIQTIFNDKLLKPIGMGMNNLGELKIYGSASRDLDATEFSITLPLEISLDFNIWHQKGLLPFKPLLIEKIALESFTFGFDAEAEIEAGLSILVKLTTQENPLIFNGKIEMGAEKTTLDASLAGLVDPFIVSWIALQDIGIEMDFDYKITEASFAVTGVPLPSGIGFKGTMKLGKKENETDIKVAGKMEIKAEVEDVITKEATATSEVATGNVNSGIKKAALSFGSFVLFGEVDHLNIMHLADLFYRMNNKKLHLPEKKLPPLEFKKVEVRIIPTNTEIADQYYRAGTEIDAEVNILGINGQMYLKVTKYGIKGFGRLDNINTPYFRLTGPGEDTVEGTNDDGFTIGMDCTTAKQDLYIMGKLEIPPLGISKDVKIDITPFGAQIEISTKLFDIFKTKLHFNFDTMHIFNADNVAQFDLGITIENDALEDVNKFLEKGIRSLTKELEKEVDKLNIDISSINDSIKKTKTAIDKKSKKSKQKT
jgi:hypothetical protein